MSDKFGAPSPRIKEKRWDKALEEELLRIWEEEKDLLKFNEDLIDEKPNLVIDTPPPYPSGKWHIAAAAHYAQHDMIARFFRLIGYNVFIPFYADRNGLPVEVYVEKKYQLNPHKLSETPQGRQHFIDLCKKELDEVEKELVNIWRRLGCSFEYLRNGTDSPEYRKLTQATFIDMWKKGYIYLDKRPVNWCPRCQTSLSEAEIEYYDETGFLYYINFGIDGSNDKVTIATTRPELLYSCGAVIFHPDDKRYQSLNGKKAVVPLYNNKVPILPHSSVDPEFGTGLMMVCSYGDWQDVRIFRELGLSPRVIIDRTGIVHDPTGIIPPNTPVNQAREIIARRLENEGYLVKKVKLTRPVPKCWRCKTPVEIIEEEEYFVKQLEFKNELLKLIENIEFYPDFHKERLVNWINSITMDWPISRSRYYGTEIPVWKCSVCGEILLPEPGKYYQPWKDEPPWSKCPRCGASSQHLVGEKKVFDTWFDSSVSPLYITKYLYNKEKALKLLRSTLRPQGYDIIRTWLYFTLLHVYLVTGQPAFRWVRISGMGLDEKGEAMHKSKGNIIDPEPIISEYGADPVRYWSAVAAKVGYDYKFNKNLLKTGQLFATKIWNIGRFISMFPDPGIENVVLEDIDKAMLETLNNYARRYRTAFMKFDTQEPTLLIYEFTWDLFASNYLEAVKFRAYNTDGAWSKNQQESVWATLHYVFREALKMIHPIMPFITDYLWRKLYGGTILTQKLDVPKTEFEFTKDYLMDDLVHINSEIWKLKKERGMKLSDPLPGVLYISQRDEPLVPYLKLLHKPSRIELVSVMPEEAVILGKSAVVLKE